jgi:DNA-binding transcriptional MocR family regulator
MKAAALARVLGSWREAEATLAAALERAISTAILDGHVARGMRLPSERSLADVLDISRVTVSAAYSRLRAEGWIETLRGAGSEVRLPSWLDARIEHEPEVNGEAIDLARAAPVAPLPAYLEALDRAANRLLGHARTPIAEMLSELRAAIADRYTMTGVPTRPEEVLVTTGAGAGLALLSRHLLRPGARALVESPTYPGALDLLRSARVGITGWPVGTGWDRELFDALLRHTHPNAVYLILDFHNPTGALASEPIRSHIVRAARAARTPLILDETLGELDLRGDGAEPLPREAPGAFRLGSLAKAVWAGLRVGWLRGPAAEIEAMAGLAEAYYLTPPVLEQLIALELLVDLDALVAARRRQLATQLRTLVSTLEHVPGVRLTQVPAGGLTTWIELPRGASSAELVRGAPGHGLRLLTGGRFSPDGTLDRFLRVPYGLPGDALQAAGERLGELIEETVGRSARPRALGRAGRS